MKKNILITLLFFCTAATKAQSTDATLNTAIDSYLGYTKTLNINKLIDFMYPKIFQLAPKKDIAASLSNLYNSDQFTAKLDSVYITKYFPVVKFSKGYFSKFTYGTILRMKFNDATDSVSQQKIFEALKVAYSDGSVTIDAEQYFRIIDFKDALAIKDNVSKNKWSFLGLKKDNGMILKLIPTEIKTAYKIK